MGFLSLYDHWKEHPKWWFNPTPEDDRQIHQSWGHLVFDNTWENVIWDEQGIEYWIGVIISHDQVPRHCKRVEGDRFNDVNGFTKQVMPLTLRIIKYRDPCLLSSFDFVFTLLPLRHIGTRDDCIFCARQSFQKLEMCVDPKERHLLRRFITATYSRMPLNQDGLCVIRDVKKWESFGDVLEYNPEFMSLTLDKSLVPEAFAKLDCGKKYNDIIVSLSGGVDSMMCMYVLWHQRRKTPFTLRAVHINYMNREDTLREEEFVVAWCAKLGIECYVRRIEELRRNESRKYGLREIYESYTKNVRFASYHHVSPLPNTYVVLGHNRDDGFENIITNIKSGKKWENLRGIELETLHGDGTMLLRPLYDTNKEAIFEFAHAHGIPYLKDTTVASCTRYKIRKQVAPVIKSFEVYNGFFKLSDMCSDLTSIVESYVNTFVDELRKSKCVCVSSGHPIISSFTFARSVFFKLLGIHLSQKSVLHYMQRMSKFKDGQKQKIMLKKCWGICVCRNNDEWLFTVELGV